MLSGTIKLLILDAHSLIHSFIHRRAGCWGLVGEWQRDPKAKNQRGA